MPPRAKTHDEYLAGVPADARAALQRLRRQIHTAAAGGEEVISYAMPGFRRPRGVYAWYAWFPNHLSLFIRPNVTDAIPEAKEHRGTKSALHFQVAKPLPAALVKKLVKAAFAERGDAPLPKPARKRAAKKAKTQTRKAPKKKGPAKRSTSHSSS